jgi:hypothetical protein
MQKRISLQCDKILTFQSYYISVHKGSLASQAFELNQVSGICRSVPACLDFICHQLIVNPKPLCGASQG